MSQQVSLPAVTAPATDKLTVWYLYPVLKTPMDGFVLAGQGLLPFLDVCCGMGAVSRTAQDLTTAARAGQADSTDALQGFQV